MQNVFLIKSILIILISVVLTGCIPVIFTGATGSVIALAKDRSAGETLTDARISAGIKAEFIKNNFRELYTKIKVEVILGRVLYTGTIDKEEDAITAVQIAWNQQGVNEVVNELKVDKSSSHFNLVQYTRDSMITSQIKSKTFMNRDIKFVNYTVITLEDIVYLFGIARSEEELEKVASIASKIHGVKKVVSHVKVDTSANKVSRKHNKIPDNDLLIDEGSIDTDNVKDKGSDW